MVCQASTYSEVLDCLWHCRILIGGRTAGDKQHSIPPSFLEAFARPGTGRTRRVHVFHRDRSYVAATVGVAAEKFFFSGRATDGEETLYEVMTRHENGPFNEDLQKLSAVGPGAMEAVLAARSIAQLGIGTGHLRGLFQTGATMLGGTIDQLFGTAGSVAEQLTADGPAVSGRFKAVFADAAVTEPYPEVWAASAGSRATCLLTAAGKPGQGG